MTKADWGELTAGLNDEDLAKLMAFREFCRALPDVEERISTSQVGYSRTRGFTSAYVKSHYLEIGIELLREVSEPKPRTTIATSKRVTMHRYSLRHIAEFTDEIKSLIREAAHTVGPGTRKQRSSKP